MQLSTEAIETVKEFIPGYATPMQFERALRMIEYNKAHLSNGLVYVQSQSEEGKVYKFPVSGKCSCKHGVEKDMVCVHRLCADLLSCEAHIRLLELAEALY